MAGATKGIAGERTWLSTKQTNQKKALAISERWEQAVRLAEKQELNTVKAAQIQKTIEELTKTPETIELTRKLFNALLRDSIQEELKGQNFGRYCEEWLDHRTPEGSVFELGEISLYSFGFRRVSW